ncbi:FMN-binding negative transcriptional regulator [Pigmentiphaga daeguensis]|uniref:FMN-binding negative transcriptional regulator n=1 Tax=Pigmentiphaga daeguensis TaxID=414049 RepID=UPI0031CEB439
MADSQAESLVVFQGPSAYVSPSLYETKRTTHEVVPTYNYAVVHARGRIIVHDDPGWVAGVVGRLTRMFEQGRDAPWKMSDAPPAFLQERLAAIVGLEMPIARLQAKWKMSQNRSEADRRGVVAGLEASGRDGDRAVAAVMKAVETGTPG